MKAIILASQVLKRKEWTPLASRILDVNDTVQTASLQPFFDAVTRPTMRIVVTERAMRVVPGAPVKVQDLLSAVNEFQQQLLRATKAYPNRDEVSLRCENARDAFKGWCDGVGLKLDWSESISAIISP